MIHLSQFKKSYRNATILSIPELVIQGGIVWIQGPNGAGKSTFFKSIAGLISYEGQVSIDGVIEQEFPADYRSHVAYCEAEPQFPSFLTQKELLNFTAKSRKSSLEELMNLVERFNTESYYNTPSGSYSSGMLKKTSLMMGLLGKKKVIALDEPFTTIDLETKKTLVDIIVKKNKVEKTLFLISTHQDQKEVPLEFDQVYRIEHSKMFSVCL